MNQVSTTKSSTPFELLFSYGHIREQYAHPAGTPAAALLHYQHLLRPEHTRTVVTSVSADRHWLENRSEPAWQLQLSPPTRQLLWELHSGIFLRLIENTSGHGWLVPDAWCRHLMLLDTGCMPATTIAQQDQESGLPITLYLLINLESGDAVLLTNPAELPTVIGFSLMVAYMSFHGDSA